MESKKCLQCNKKFEAIETRNYISLKTGIIKNYRNHIKKQKFCSRKCYHLSTKDKPQTGIKLQKSRESIKMAIAARKNNPQIRKKWLAKMKEVQLGKRNSVWIVDRTKLANQGERNGYDDLVWKRAVYKRDNYKCKINDVNCLGRIEAHHILSWRDFVELRYEINNGITLCHAHHPRVRSEEKRLIPTFKELVTVSNDTF